MSSRRNTHDIGFIVMPALRLDWELTGNARSFKSIMTAAESLASRYDERVGAIRSWDKQFSHRYSITDMNENFLVIIDSMCSMPSPCELKIDCEMLIDICRSGPTLLRWLSHRQSAIY